LIELAFVRFKSTAKNPGPPIVYLAGGSGGSGIGAARGSRFPLFMALREIADVIAFDQSGCRDQSRSADRKRGSGLLGVDESCLRSFGSSTARFVL
jgi:pimeloyl-ACP methyl ester carboxylesterase